MKILILVAILTIFAVIFDGIGWYLQTKGYDNVDKRLKKIGENFSMVGSIFEIGDGVYAIIYLIIRYF